MTTEAKSIEQRPQRTRVIYKGGASEAVYGFGLFGAWFYYLSQATTIWMGILGIFKGIFWPAMLVYELFKFLNL